MLSDKQLRAAYDKYGKEGAKPESGFGAYTPSAGFLPHGWEKEQDG